jgi:hypothetical protein
MTFEENMTLALALYQTGESVVLKEKGGRIIHGEETLKTTDLSKCRIIDAIDFDEWKTSHWPQLLERARQGWLKNNAGRRVANTGIANRCSGLTGSNGETLCAVCTLFAHSRLATEATRTLG